MKNFNTWLEETNKDFIKKIREKQSPVISFDQDRYTAIDGLEGPFVLRSGKVVYYDPKEGKYYDRDSDMYMSYEDYEAHNNLRNQLA
jgi:hypothetical protein